MDSLGFFPERLVGERQADWEAEVNMRSELEQRRHPSPLWGGWPAEGRVGGCFSKRDIRALPCANPHPALRATLPTRGRDKKDAYTDAVVTPPSTTMVWPVMKVEASEPR